ncbi:glutamate mutase L [Nocardioides pocheonensis]|uniref:Glutamate mutase n=1 Tax=Nocardioides pocheonensis TaxID=661485 RepID=A0A3N0GKF6_9ACTN|nr:glutamate mutase L [Nocardioides pocheonensis]RNM12964.1 glutamate mutase [Nocardioides pocheonensis]
MTAPSSDWVVCVDFGSTFTKAALVDTGAGELLATTQHRTTLPGPTGGDVLDGYDACLAALEQEHPGAADARTLACSSAGGGLRVAVLGNEALVTAEAGRRVALSSGGKVVVVLGSDRASGELAAAFAETRPDVLLLTGGTDGGDRESVVAAAAEVAASGWRGPVVVAANRDAQETVVGLLADVSHVVADNVVPRIGVLAPESARRAIREVFLSHVIGGKHLSARTTRAGQTFASMVRGATPDVVLTGVELLAAQLDTSVPGGGVVVVDIGGATTDVHSVVVLDPEEAGLSREVVATTPVTRTVEGDLGMRWSAATTAEAAAEAGLALPADAVRRAADPAYLPEDEDERAGDEALATAAGLLAVRRHVGRSRVVLSPEGRVVERTGKDLRAVELLVGSGGVLRAADPARARRILAAATGRDPEGWQLPEDPRIVVDRDYVLAAAGLLALDGDAARAQAEHLLCNSLSRWR